MNRLFLMLFGLLITHSAIAQSDVLIEVQDKETSEPISFATAKIKDSQRGIIADYYGQFRFPITQINDMPFLIISSLGFASLEIDLRKLDPKLINVIKLSPQAETLEEVVLEYAKSDDIKVDQLKNLITSRKNFSAYELVYRAIASITSNLNNKPHSYIGYYRDYQFYDNQYYNLNEGILEQFDAGIQTRKIIDSLNQTALYSFKQNNNFKTDSLFSRAYNGNTKFVQDAQIYSFGGNELSILNIHNPIRNFDQNTFSFVYHLNKEFLDFHTFEKAETFFISDDPIITIQFTNQEKKTSYRHNVT